ncbi:hypothetical protein WCLP8_4660013 [uncultured Gammaproteobacteria bacterium]
MSMITIDTLKLSERLHGAGFTRRQAAGAAEGIAEALGATYPTKDAVIDVVETLGRSVDRRFTSLEIKVDRLEAGQAKLEAGQAKLEAGQAKLESGQTDLKSSVTKLESSVTKLQSGQAVLMENQLQVNSKLDAIMAHLGIATK